MQKYTVSFDGLLLFKRVAQQCHSFDERKINVKFENFHHPRFGEIIGLVTICDINTGDEILVNYNYKNIQKAPEWYKSLWKSHKAQFKR